jgi:hypothetical protein
VWQPGKLQCITPWRHGVSSSSIRGSQFMRLFGPVVTAKGRGGVQGGDGPIGGWHRGAHMRVSAESSFGLVKPCLVLNFLIFSITSNF